MSLGVVMLGGAAGGRKVWASEEQDGVIVSPRLLAESSSYRIQRGSHVTLTESSVMHHF